MKNYIWAALLLIAAGCSADSSDSFGEQGVSRKLADYRKEHLGDVHYSLCFAIPALSQEAIPGSAEIEFKVKNRLRKPLLIDFNVPDDHLISLTVNGITQPALVENGHIAILPAGLVKGVNRVELAFRTGEQSLNRNDDYLYTLLVPDRASTMFPCFDQPDIKARFSLTLELPEGFEAISNNSIESDTSANGTRQMRFSAGKPISTYLFAFAAGRFERVVTEKGGISMEMLHRETDTAALNRNLGEIFSLHESSVKWMEEYTGIPYPFDKFGFVLIPSFQYGGMEHPGAIFYRASSLVLEQSATVTEQMSRASLIAHETSHIWFGDLVTMRWFDDVWLKEVFAGYMADKMVNPSFPNVNHELRFLLSRYPAAYAVDRTRGSNPILQELDNLRNAGSVYGGIIYNKAPIVMKHLERMTGDKLLRDSLREYLLRYSFGNASWDELIAIIEEISGVTLGEWSNIWVREPGMPVVNTRIERSEQGFITSFSVTDPAGKGRIWPQQLNAKVITEEGDFHGSCIPGTDSSFIATELQPLFVIPDTPGIAYGFFAFDSATISLFTDTLMTVDEPLVRGVVWLNANENMINGLISPVVFFKRAMQQSLAESDEVLLNYLQGRVNSVFWNHLNEDERHITGEQAEAEVWKKIESTALSAPLRRSWFNLYRSLALTDHAIQNLYGVWQTGTLPGGQTLSEDELCTLALTLALKGHAGSVSILSLQAERIKSSERHKRFSFVVPSVSGSQQIRDDFFSSLADKTNREKEPWVLEALGYLHHPIRAENSEKYILPSLEMLEEIKFTGDIFFPAGWAGSILGSYRTRSAYETVSGFLEERPGYPSDLRLKILQAADNLYRHNTTGTYNSLNR